MRNGGIWKASGVRQGKGGDEREGVGFKHEGERERVCVYVWEGEGYRDGSECNGVVTRIGTRPVY